MDDHVWGRYRRKTFSVRTENGSTSSFLATESTMSAACDGTLEEFSFRPPFTYEC